MSAVWLKLITFLCLCCTGLSHQGNGKVVWRNPGEDFTVQCKPPLEPDYTLLSVKRGLEEEQIFVQEKYEVKPTISQNFTARMQLNGVFPNINILIQNVTASDTGPYWCIYSKFDNKIRKPTEKHGEGSVLLVVKETEKETECEHRPEDTSENLVLVSVVISAVVLLAIIMGLLIWILKGKTVCRTVKQRRAPTNDVYEDMRSAMGR